MTGTWADPRAGGEAHVEREARALLLWVVATGVAVGVAVTAVDLATGRVRQAPLAVELATGDRVPTTGTSDTGPPPRDGPGAPAPTAPGSSTPVPSPGAPGDDPDTAAPPDTTAGGGGPSDGTTAAPPTPAPTAPTPSATPSPDATSRPTDGDDDGDPGGQDEVRTASAIGGSARFRAVDGRVELVFATPAQGFQVRVRGDGTREVRVELVSPEHTSRIDADLDDGRLRVRVDERPED